MASEFIPIALTQLWQITLLILVVAAVSRWLSPRRPHLSHLLWLVVLLKCVTPPLWTSPGGVFCWLQPEQQVEVPIVENVEWVAAPWNDLLEFDTSASAVAETSSAPFSGVSLNTIPEVDLFALFATESVIEAASSEPSSAWIGKTAIAAWLVISAFVLLGVTVSWWRFWKLVRASDQRDSPELEALLQSLSKQLSVRRRVRLIVTESLVGPAVVGFFRVTVLIPAVVVDKLKGKSVEPILAHELLHIRRGDLWVGLLQTLAQAMWWFHPLVWWVGRVTTREAERCCDEEVLGELKCDPASYARALLDVLDLKSQLKPVPVFPGVRPVDVTSQRLERIMTLRQGCRRRSPWWCWLVAIGAAVLTLPGAAFVVSAQEKELQVVFSHPATSFPAEPAPLAKDSPEPARARPEALQFNVLTPADRDGAVKTVVYDLGEFAHLLTGTEAEQHQKFERLVRSRSQSVEAEISWFDGRPVVKTTNAGHLAVRQCLSLFVENEADSKTFAEFLDSLLTLPKAVLMCDLQLVTVSNQAYSNLEDVVLKHVGANEELFPWVLPKEKCDAALESVPSEDRFHFVAPQLTLVNGATVQAEGVAHHPYSLKREKYSTLVPCMNWSGWKLNSLPFQRKDGSFWLGMWLEAGAVVGKQELTPAQSRQLGATGTATVHAYYQLNVAASLKEGDVVVLPGFDDSHGHSSEQLTILTARVRRLSEKPIPDAVSAPRAVSGTGVTSDAGVTGKIILDSVPATTESQAATTIRQASAQNAESRELPKPVQVPGGMLLTRRPVGSLLMTLRNRGDGSVSPRLTVLFEDADGNDVLVGTADDVQLHVTKNAKIDETSVEMANAQLQTVGTPRQRFSAKRLRLINERGSADKPRLRMQLESSEVQFQSAGHESKLKAERIELQLNPAPFGVEQVRADGLGSLKTDAPISSDSKAEPEEGPWDDVKHRRTQQQAERALNTSQALPSPYADDADGILNRKTEVSFQDVSLADAVKELARQHGVNIVLDKRGLVKEGVTLNAKISLDVSGISLRSALKLMLGPLNLGMRIGEDDVIIVTSRSRLAGAPVTMTYPVADLVVPIPARVRLEMPGPATTPKTDATTSDTTGTEPLPGPWRVATPLPETKQTTQIDFRQLIALITQTVEPDSWSERGGSGSIASHESTLSLVIRQTPTVHEQISDLINQLRRLQDVQVTLQMQPLEVPQNFLTEWNVDLTFKPMPESKSHRWMRLSTAQADELRTAGKSVSFPKVTLFNGQHCECLLETQGGRQPGWHVQPVVSGDRQWVRLGLGIDDGRKESSGEAIPTSVTTIRDGDALLVEVTEEADETSPIVAVPIPGQPRAFKRVPGSRRFVLIQPRVIVAEEEEELLGIDVGN